VLRGAFGPFAGRESRTAPGHRRRDLRTAHQRQPGLSMLGCDVSLSWLVSYFEPYTVGTLTALFFSLVHCAFPASSLCPVACPMANFRPARWSLPSIRRIGLAHGGPTPLRCPPNETGAGANAATAAVRTQVLLGSVSAAVAAVGASARAGPAAMTEEVGVAAAAAAAAAVVAAVGRCRGARRVGSVRGAASGPRSW